jgi:hypothetical protein
MAIWEAGGWLAAPTGVGTSTSGWWQTYGGPAVTAAIVTVVLGGAIQYGFAMRKDRATASRDLQLKSLNEFYAPIKTLLAGNLVLRNALRAEFAVAEDATWHMLDHLEEIKANQTACKIVEEVIGINKKIGEILESKSGLDLGQSAHIARWEVHRRLLDRAFNGTTGAIRGELTYFPTHFEDDIVKMHDELLSAVKSSVRMKK